MDCTECFVCATLRRASQKSEGESVPLLFFTPKAESAADAFLIKNALALLLIPPAFHKRRKQNQPTRFLALRASERVASFTTRPKTTHGMMR
jgi:hypothetical protein